MTDFVVKDGLIALQHRTTNGTNFKMDADGTVYTWVPQHNVSIALVRPEHLDALLKVQAKICCGRKANKFFPASQINYNIWVSGNRYGEMP